MKNKLLIIIYINCLLFVNISYAEEVIDPRNNWGLEALGPDVPRPEWKAPPIKQELETNFKTYSISGESLVFVSDKKARTVLVLPKEASSSAQQAADVLQHAFEKISRVKIPIAAEDAIQNRSGSFVFGDEVYDSLISIGDTRLAREASVDVDDLKLDGYRLRTEGNILFIRGQDKEPFMDTAGRALPKHEIKLTRYLQANGTRNGAYALLERYFGVRWLWPEEAGGTIYPQHSILKLSPIHETDEPAIAARGIRNSLPEQRFNSDSHRTQKTILSYFDRSYSNFLDKSANSGIWLEAMRLGTSVEYNLGHSFQDYWKRFGKTHPEYFALQGDGTREIDRWHPNVDSYAHLDVSNPSLIEQVANDVIAKFDTNPELTSVSIAPNDGSYPSFCLCEVCRRLDPPQGTLISFSIINEKGQASGIKYPSLSDRYVLFYSKIAEKVAEKYPNKLLGAYAYSVYSAPPHYAKLAPNVFIAYVGYSYFNEAQRTQDRKDWDIWADAGGQMILRPNSLLGLYGISANFTHKLGEDIKHAYRTGMIGTDFDSLTHDWAGRGLNYYVLAKLLWDPSQDIDEIIKDYCDSGFGSASEQIQKYFSELEILTNEVANYTGEIAKTEDGLNNIAMASSLQYMLHFYTPERIEQLQEILDKAKEQTTDTDILQRIDFLEQGVRYARIEVKVLRTRFFHERNIEKIKEVLQERKEVYQDIYDNYFYAQGLLSMLYRTDSLWKEYNLDGLGNELKK